MAAVHTSDKSGSRRPLVGAGEYLYECDHDWAQLPDGFRWKNTHGVTIDRAGQIYIKHQGEPDSPLDTVLIFDPDGKFLRSFGQEYTAEDMESMSASRTVLSTSICATRSGGRSSRPICRGVDLEAAVPA